MSRWPLVALRELITLDLDRVSIDPSAEYPMVGVLSFGRGLFDREPVINGATSYKFFNRLKADHFVMSQLFGWEGALALSSENFAGKFVSPQFPTFLCNSDRLERRFLFWVTQLPSLWADLGTRAIGMGDRRRTLSPDSLFKCNIPLPPLSEQRRLVKYMDALASKIEEAKTNAEAVTQQNERLLRTVLHQLTKDVPRRMFGEIAPLTRRPASIDPFKQYPQVSVRSFGRGTFHNPPLAGSEITWEKPHLVKTGDVLISNIKAWEGAIAVAGAEDDDRYGSHRYLTFVPVEGVVTARFLCSYLLTPEGLYHVGEASPGSADRNRTTSARGLQEIPIPLPSYESQIWFGELFDKIRSVKTLQSETATEREAMLPAILDRAFRGEL